MELRRPGVNTIGTTTTITRGTAVPLIMEISVLDCAELAREGMLIADVRLMGEELIDAGKEAGVKLETVVPEVEYNAHDVLNVKKYYSL